MKYILYFVGAILLIGVLGVVVNYISAGAQVLSTPANIIKKTVNADNVLNNYEWYYDYNAQYISRTNQITSYKEMLEDTTLSSQEKTNLRIELAGMKQVCRDLAVQYNAQSQKLNRKLFKSSSLPYQLSLNNCN